MKRWLLVFLLPFLSLRAEVIVPDWESTEDVYRWIQSERVLYLREQMLRMFIEQLPVDDFNEISERIWQDSPYQVNPLTKSILYQWGRIDYLSAWPVVQSLFEVAASNHYSDSWDERIYGPGSTEEIQSSLVWVTPSQLEGYLAGLESGGGLQVPQGRDLSKQFRSRYQLQFPNHPLRSRYSGGSDLDSAPYFEDLKVVLECDASAIPAILKLRSLQTNVPARVIGIRRWAQVDPKSAADSAGDWSGEVYRVWLQNDPRSLVDELESNEHPIAQENILAVLLGCEEKVMIDQGVEILSDFIDPILIQNTLIRLAGTKPVKAIELLEANDLIEKNREYIRARILQQAFTNPESKQARSDSISILEEFDPPVISIGASAIMEEWGDLDVGRAARFGVNWHLAAIKHRKNLGIEEKEKWISWDRDHLIQTWGGSRDPEDASIDDRTFGCLRKWAVCLPEEMIDWLPSVADKEVRDALKRLHTIAASGPE